MDTISSEILVVGGGAVGLAIANKFAKRGHETILVEKNKFLAEEVSARNSGVVHAGFYYPKHSLKSLLCNQGNKMLYQYCGERGISINKTGKLVLGNSKEDRMKLIQYVENASYYGGDPLEIIDQKNLKKIEPNVKSEFAMLSPETGIVDVHSFCNSLANEFESFGGHLSLRTYFKNFEKDESYFLSHVSTEGVDFIVKSNFLILAAGLHSWDLSKTLNCKRDNFKKLNLSKGHYFKLKGASPFNYLIYPMPTFYGLGIHAGFDIDGSVRFGPDTELTDTLDYSFDSSLKKKFYNAIKLYYPAIKEDDLVEDYVGIRPKIQTPDEDFADFSILTCKEHEIENLIFLQGIESPGLTCSLMLSKYIYNEMYN